MNHTAEVQQSLEEVQALLAHLETASWVEEDWGMLQRVLRSYARLLGTLFEAQMTLKRLQALLCGTRRRRRTSSASAASADAVGRGEEAGKGAGGGGNEASGADAGVALDEAGSAAAGHAPRSGGHRPGSGRLGAEAYEGAERVECRHEALAVGERCPVCGQGRLYALPPGVEIRIDGNALLSAIRYEVEKLRCSACGQVFTATLPAEAAAEKYSPLPAKQIVMGHTPLPCAKLMPTAQARRGITRRRGNRRGQSGLSPQAGTVQGRAAWGPRPMQVPRASSAATRSWRWVSAVRCVVRATSMRCPPGWRCASTAMPCSVPYSTSEQSDAARRAGPSLRPGCLRA